MDEPRKELGPDRWAEIVPLFFGYRIIVTDGYCVFDSW